MNRQHSFISSFICTVLVICILAPSITKLSHALYEHHYLDCDDANTLHIHEAELDCDFQKFQLSPQFTPSFFTFSEYRASDIQENNFNLYFFLSKYQKLHFALRGPPYIS